MLIYFISAICSSFFLLIHRKYLQTNKLLSSYIIFIAFMFFWLISALRFEVGTDFYAYYNYITNLEFVRIKNNEYGMMFLAELINLFTTEGQYLIILSSLIVFSLIFYTIVKYSSYPEISVILFFALGYYFTSLNIVRQYLAISILFYASIKYLGKKDLIYLLFNLIAITFHFTAIMGFVIYILEKISKQDKIIKYTFVSLFILSMIFYENLISLLANSYYLDYQNTAYITEGANIIFFILYGGIFIVLLFFKDKIIELNPRNNHLFLIVLVGVLISFVGTQSLIVMRLADYFTLYIVLLIADLLKVLKDPRIRALSVSYTFIFSLIVMYIFLSRNLGDVLPYTSIFSGKLN